VQLVQERRAKPQAKYQHVRVVLIRIYAHLELQQRPIQVGLQILLLLFLSGSLREVDTVPADAISTDDRVRVRVSGMGGRRYSPDDRDRVSGRVSMSEILTQNSVVYPFVKNKTTDCCWSKDSRVNSETVG